MPLKPGTRLGQYEIRELLGAGGMGEVYRAQDLKLERDVALKVLPEIFARDPDRLWRFHREARLLASLNHPNIAAIYGLEESGETHHLVMELVPGETLRETLHPLRAPDSTRDRKGANKPRLSLEEALRIATQICEALEAAHEKNIIHRDLKPANIKITPEGKVKVLDFGLAKAFAAEPETIDPHDSPTAINTSLSMPEAILGTPAYMSPEQARGKQVDKRTDIWAFGCVLYEMLTSQQAFPGESVTEILGGILKSEPDWSALPQELPANIRFVLRRCLEKDLTRRLSGASDLRIMIEDALMSPAVPAVGVPGLAGWRKAIPFLATALVAAAVGASIAIWNVRPSGSVSLARPVTRLTVPLASAEQLANSNANIMALSPDSTQLVYVSSREGMTQLYLRAMDSLEVKVISGTERGVGPFFSPDGQWIGFFGGGKLKKVSISGGTPVILADAAAPSGGAWGPDDTIIFAPQSISGLRRVPAAGGTPQVLTTPDPNKGEGRHVSPQILPGGKAVLFTASIPASEGGSQVVVQSLETSERKVLVQGGSGAYYAPSGHLVYARGTTLMAVPFDVQHLQVTGASVPVVDGVMLSAFGLPQFALSDMGTLVYAPGGSQTAGPRLVWVDRKGMAERIAAPAHGYQYPRLSPDGTRIAVGIQEAPNRDVWIYDIRRDTLTRLTFEADNSSPVWTPDGKKVAYRSTKGGAANIFWKPADGTGTEERLTISENTHTPMLFSPDGKFLAYHELNPKSGGDIWLLPLEGERKPRLFLQTPFNESTPMFSLDGRWIAYVSDESGRAEIYIRPFPGPGGKWQISTEGGIEPLWNPNGLELFYRNGDKMMSVDVVADSTVTVGKPKLVFEGRYQTPGGLNRTTYDVTHDGQRFLMYRSEQEGAGLTQLNVVQNWFEELKRKVPTKQ